jgi:hypothetical protein
MDVRLRRTRRRVARAGELGEEPAVGERVVHDDRVAEPRRARAGAERVHLDRSRELRAGLVVDVELPASRAVHRLHVEERRDVADRVGRDRARVRVPGMFTSIANDATAFA